MTHSPVRNALGILRLCALPFLMYAASCGGSSSDNPTVPTGVVRVRMDFSRAASLYDAPFPSADLMTSEGQVEISAFPNPSRAGIVDQAIRLIERDNDGFGLTSGVFLSLTGAIDRTRLPSIEDTLSAHSPVFLMSVDDRKQVPVRVDFVTDGGPFGAPNLLSLVPYQGIPLRPKTQYVAAVCVDLLDTSGYRLAQDPTVAAGTPGIGMLNDDDANAYKRALTAASSRCTVAGLSTFTTGDPVASFARFTADALARRLPVPRAFTRGEVFDDYCVYASTVDMPDYQQGTPPYSNVGGDWQMDAGGDPIAPHYETASLFVSVPRRAMPTDGFPTAVFVRAGGGGDRPLIDRGVHATAGGPAVPGSGPAQEFARVGYAGVQVDGPLGGLRNTTHGDEQFLVFNVFNVASLRDTVRESALELVVLSHILDELEIDTSECPGAPTRMKFDPVDRALMGHSTGATIAPLALAIDPHFRAAVFSGEGGSYIENVLYKRKPIEILPAAILFLRYGDRTLTENDPALNLVQWAVESSDPPVYADSIIRHPAYRGSPAHVLMLQGIVDNYILPNIANASSLSLGLDLVGPALDDPNQPGLADQTPILSVLPLSGRKQISYPAKCNLKVGDDCVTAVLAQHPGDGIEDGHETVFQTEPPKAQYRAFLTSLLDGVPTVPGE